MDKIGRNSDKGKEKATSPVKVRDFTRPSQEKLTLDPQHDILKGGMDKASSSKRKLETTRQQTTNQQETSTQRVKRRLEDMYTRAILENSRFKAKLSTERSKKATAEQRASLTSKFHSGEIDLKQYEDETKKIFDDWIEKDNYWSTSTEKYY